MMFANSIVEGSFSTSYFYNNKNWKQTCYLLFYFAQVV